MLTHRPPPRFAHQKCLQRHWQFGAPSDRSLLDHGGRRRGAAARAARVGPRAHFPVLTGGTRTAGLPVSHATPLRGTHACSKDTSIFVKHRRPYKLLIDTLRIGLANAESELAARLAPHLTRATEAKKTLKNLLVAPGTVRVNKRSVNITLSPAGTSLELEAFQELLTQLNELSLVLPGDSERRRLRFGLTKQ